LAEENDGPGPDGNANAILGEGTPPGKTWSRAFVGVVMVVHAGFATLLAKAGA